MGAPGEVRLARPDKPDAWMLSTENKTVRVACANRSVTFAPIRVWLQKMRSCRVRIPFEEAEHGDTKYLALATGVPKIVPRGTLERMRRQLRTTDVNVLARYLQDEAILVLDEQTGQTRFDWKKYARLWEDFCLVWRTRQNITRCTCFSFCWTGHCVHYYTANEYWRAAVYAGPLIPNVGRAPAADSDRGSEDEDERLRRRRRVSR